MRPEALELLSLVRMGSDMAFFPVRVATLNALHLDIQNPYSGKSALNYRQEEIGRKRSEVLRKALATTGGES
jgi:protein-arginine kinase